MEELVILFILRLLSFAHLCSPFHFGSPVPLSLCFGLFCP